MIIFETFGMREVGRVRDTNEDYYAIIVPEDDYALQDRGRMFVVADGMGGNGKGELASKMAVQTVAESYYSGEGGDDLGDSLRYAVERAHEAIWKSASQNPEYYKMGATMTAMVIQGDKVFIAHVGDTRAYVVRRGKIQQLTQDHNWAGDQLRKGAITKVHAEAHPRRKVLTRSLGQAPEVEVDLYEDTVEQQDIFFLCSDGLYDTLSDSEIQKVLNDTNPEMAARELVARANRNGGADNISAIVVKTIFEGKPFLAKERSRKSFNFRLPFELKIPSLPKNFPLPVILVGASVSLVIIIGGLWIFFQNPSPGPKPNNPINGTPIINPGNGTPAKVKIETRPSGAVIKVDGVQLGPSPISVPLLPGPHQIEITKDGYQTKKVELKVKKGEQQIPLNYLLVPNQEQRSPGMSFVPAGFFILGRDDASQEEGPRHKIYLDAYYIDRYEVTNEQYRHFIEQTGHRSPLFWSNPKYNAPRQPVVGVSWKDADAYCRWESKRLPTEVEWEKAARGADSLLYPWGNQFEAQMANIKGDADGFQGLAPVDSLSEGKSPYGIYHMIGNAAEWTDDYFDASFYQSIAMKNPRGPDTGLRKTVRGGSFKTPMKYTTATYRSAFAPTQSKENIGFRCAKD